MVTSSKFVKPPNDKRTAKIILKVLEMIIMTDVKVYEFVELCETIYRWNELSDETQPLTPTIISIIKDIPLQSDISPINGINGELSIQIEEDMHLKAVYYNEIDRIFCESDNEPADFESEVYASKTDGEKHQAVPMTVIDGNEDDKSSTGSQYEDVTALNDLPPKKVGSSKDNASTMNAPTDHEKNTVAPNAEIRNERNTK